MKLARWLLIIVGIVSILMAAIGICFNLATIFFNILLATQATNNLCSRPVLFVASAISTICYLVLLFCGVQFVRLRTGLTVFGLFVGVIVFEIVLFLFSGIMAAFFVSKTNFSLAYIMAMSGMMFQVYILFPLWAPCLAWWAARKIERNLAASGQFPLGTPESAIAAEPCAAYVDVDADGHTCSLWRRILALIIDGVVIVMIGMLLGLCFGSWFSTLHPHERLVGAAVIIIYFALLNSKLSNGQTPGKWLLRIRVVTAAGAPPSFIRALLRIIVLSIPLIVICDGVEEVRPELYRYYYCAITTIFVGGLGTIAYLAIFNFATRQSLHDIICGTYVVRTNGVSCIPTRRPWRGHWVIIGVFVLVCTLASYAMGTQFKPEGGDFENTALAIQNNSNCDWATTWLYSSAAMSNVENGGDSYRIQYDTFMVSASMRQPPADYAKEAARVAHIVLDKYPNAQNLYAIEILVSHGYDIGIYRSWYTWHEAKSPAEWGQVDVH